MKLCAECKHWQARHPSLVLGDPGGGFRYCARIGTDDEVSGEPRIDALYDAGFGHTSDAALVTPADFGCALGEAKP